MSPSLKLGMPDGTVGWAVESPEAARDSIHRRPFNIRHELHNNELFSLDALRVLSSEIQLRPEDFYFDAGPVSISDRWGAIPVPKISLPELIGQMETSDAWIIMKHVEKNPRYGAVLNEFAEFIWGVLGPDMARMLQNPEMLVIINSPNRITPLHFDAEINFLIQVAGNKSVWVCDPTDRSVVSERDLERYYSYSDFGTYRPIAEEKAVRYTLAPGEGIHIPTHGAHWVRNGTCVSVSLSLNFEFPTWVHRDFYRANNFLRKMGLSPQPRGVRPVMDRMKSASVGAVDYGRVVTKRVLRRV
ncbi:MAG: cupin-like domain-containing protein [Proteobacteria bacterium]|nr:cupin-like domain-containing protein [Pseudomonadota bacterium]